MTAPLSEDLLDGAQAIAEYLGGRWNANKVRIAKSRRQLPIRSMPGAPLYALKSELDAHFRAPERLNMESAA